VTYLTLFIVGFMAFYQAHKGESAGSFALAAIVEVINTMWSFIAPEVGRRQEQADKWREEKVPQIKQSVHFPFPSLPRRTDPQVHPERLIPGP
jgi:hypothetical protein